MQLLHALIIALLTWLVATAFPMWLRWSMYFGAPLVAGLINGILLGDMTYGLQCGGTIMMAYIGLVAIGGSLPSDLSLAGYLGVYMTMASHADPSVGLPIAVSLGFLGILCSNAKMALNPIWVHKADQYAAQGNDRGVVALGLAMLMNMMNKRSTIPFFFMGFVLAAYLKLDIIALAILGAAFGMLHLLYTRGRRTEENA